VRLNREIRNPKSVIVSIVLPGEAKEAETSNEAAAESFADTPLISYASDEAGTSELVMRTASNEVPATDEEDRPEMGLVIASAEAPATEILTDLTSATDSDNSRPLVRRRRRRSSATDSADATDSES